MKERDRRIGLEQEFFLVDTSGAISDRADEFLEHCRALATTQGRNPDYFAPEFVKNMVEVNTPPVYRMSELAIEYLENLKLALHVAHELDLRLYPLSQYPLHFTPVIRNELNYHVQARTVGYDRFLRAGRCIGTHLHIELPPGTIDPDIGISYETSSADRAEALSLYNLVTALDPALIAFSRACPFYEGNVFGLAARTVHYRGSYDFGWEGVYTHLPQAGELQPYATNVASLVRMQFARYYAWLEAMDRADVKRSLFFEAGGSLLKSAWNPVRLNALGTVESRGTDSDYPSVILAIAALVYSAAIRVRHEGLTVRPVAGVHAFEIYEDLLAVPEFDYLNGTLLYAATTEGVKHPDVIAYLNSILAFVKESDPDSAIYLQTFGISIENYKTTETEILQEFAPVTAEISRDDGLRLVRKACDIFERQVSMLVGQHA
ncbi:MAG: glutamate-cysteine ligase family protein [Elainellaceae cyanobacterium]